MSKSRKNIVDPENVIKNYGADSIRWFILSDSPPNREILWSDEGISSAYKFIQKLCNLNLNINKRKIATTKNNRNKDLEKYTNKMIFEITKNLENFHYNVVVANFYDIYNNFSDFFSNQEISNESLKVNFEKILILIMPILPHFACECLSKNNSRLNLEKLVWPIFNKALIEDEDCNIVIQINGKKRGLIKLPKNTSETLVAKKAKDEVNVKKYLINNNIKKQIYVKNKLINFII